MKKIIVILIALISFSSCKNEAKQKVNLEENRAKSYDANDGLITMRGEYVYYTDAAVLQTANEIYGVVIDDNLQLLEEQVKPFKKEATDMVPVTVRVRKFEKPEGEEGWQYRVEIKEILKVEAPDQNKEDVIKLGN
ncbi:hypothetical protein H8K90_05810 [Winogradskyella echinorum]|uniref:NlpE C-terminal OB domain-containing protein n=1 Tax=Winogradskyella echinorum TaxID=538189 RepID=A0ABR6Y0T7_9FLAO|nr:hypothetical protein [Winogradskyella echinorum]MBC3845885.1 hypothetical protein [Winogradskyella echinorum]MBC5750233.1 hypothetical protein [Winogradskyella echinorum]